MSIEYQGQFAAPIELELRKKIISSVKAICHEIGYPVIGTDETGLKIQCPAYDLNNEESINIVITSTDVFIDFRISTPQERNQFLEFVNSILSGENVICRIQEI